MIKILQQAKISGKNPTASEKKLRFCSLCGFYKKKQED